MRKELEKYFKKIGMQSKDLKALSPIERKEYLFEIYTHHIEALPYHNFELREISQQHLLQRQSLKLNSFWKLLEENSGGGYCYQLALLLKSALDELGYQVDCCAARVLNGLPVNSPELLIIPPTHLILVVTLAEEKLLLDAGLGPRAPRIPLLISEFSATPQPSTGQHRFYQLEEKGVYVLERLGRDPQTFEFKWERLIQTDLLPIDSKTQQTLLNKLGTFPYEIGIRDSKVVMGSVTPAGSKFLFWNKISRQLEFSYEEQNSNKKISIKFFLESHSHACAVLKKEFNFDITAKELETACSDAPLPKIACTIEFPLDEAEKSNMIKKLGL